MKKILTTAAFAVSLTFIVCGQKIDASKVPAQVKTAFTKEYPGVSPKWEKEDGNYEASFKKDAMDMSVVITPAGHTLNTEIDIKSTELPFASN